MKNRLLHSPNSIRDLTVNRIECHMNHQANTYKPCFTKEAETEINTDRD